IERILTRRGLRTGRCVAMPFDKIAAARIRAALHDRTRQTTWIDLDDGWQLEQIERPDAQTSVPKREQMRHSAERAWPHGSCIVELKDGLRLVALFRSTVQHRVGRWSKSLAAAPEGPWAR